MVLLLLCRKDEKLIPYLLVCSIIYHNLFIHSTIDGFASCFLLWFWLRIRLLWIFLNILCTFIHIAVGFIYLGVELPGQKGMCVYWAFTDTVNFLRCLHPFILPTCSMQKFQLFHSFAKNYQWSGTSLVAQLVKNPPAVQETLVLLLGQEDPLEKG